MGKSKLTFKHKTNVVNLANFLNKRGRLPKFENTKFQAESLGLSLDASYVVGKFAIEPQGYFDIIYLQRQTINWQNILQ